MKIYRVVPQRERGNMQNEIHILVYIWPR